MPLTNLVDVYKLSLLLEVVVYARATSISLTQGLMVHLPICLSILSVPSHY